MTTPAWSTQQLAEFVAAISAADSEAAAGHAAVERAGEALDADVAAIVCDGKALAAVGYPDGSAPVDELEAVKPGVAGGYLNVPGVGACPAAAAALDHPDGATLVVARAENLTREEVGLLRGMGRVASMTMRMLCVLDDERAAREELERLARTQAALRRVATVVASRAPPEEVFAAVAAEAGSVLPEVDLTLIGRYDSDTIEFVASWTRGGDTTFVGRQVGLGGENVATAVFQRNAPAQFDRLVDVTSDASRPALDRWRSCAGAPINGGGRLWGVMMVASIQENGLSAGLEHRLADFVEFIATAIANAQAREELRQVADEQAALRRVATLVAQGQSPDKVFKAVAAEVGRLFPAEYAIVIRYGAGGTATVLGSWGSAAEAALGRTFTLDPGTATTAVFETGAPVRIDTYADLTGPSIAAARALGIAATSAAPIRVEGHLWGAVIASSARSEVLPPGAEEGLADFTELVATAISNAQAREELRAIADEQAALRRVATLVAQGGTPTEVFAAVTREVVAIAASDALIVRLDPDGDGTVVAHVGARLAEIPVGSRWKLEPPLAVAKAVRTGRAARTDSYAEAAGGLAGVIRTSGIRSAVANPIVVGGRIWGAIAIGTGGESFPTDTEQRMVDFTELLATAIANAQAQAELTASRARIAATADETRRRIERDLHDGAQQRLVSLALQLRAARATLPTDLEELASELDHVADGLTAALDELRELARGIHPPILAEGGLEPALSTLARRSAVPVQLEVRTRGRLPEPVEVGAYYIIAESLTNAAKHAHASAVAVDVQADNGMLLVRVRDDGIGGADISGGSGLLGLKDRVDALGGRIEVHSEPGAGTSLTVTLPLVAKTASVFV